MIEFFVAGIPGPRGSKKAFPFKRKNGTIGVAVSDANPKSRDWMNLVSTAATEAMQGREPFREPVALELSFVMPRLKGHYGTGKNASVLKPSAPKWHSVKPDALKLARGTEDALTGIVFADDALVARESFEKAYGNKPGVYVRVFPLTTIQRSLL